MKRFNLSLAIAAVALTSVFGLTSCEKDEYVPLPQQRMEEMDEDFEECDSLDSDTTTFVSDLAFDYSDAGPTSADNQMETLDLGYNVDPNAPQTRSVVAAMTISYVSKQLLHWAADQALKNVESKAASAVLNALFGSSQSTTIDQLQNINDQLEKTHDFAKELDSKVAFMNYADRMAKRIKYYENLNNSTRDIFKKVLEYRNDTVQVAKILNDWNNDEKINGEMPALATQSFMDFLASDYTGSHEPMPAIYDAYIFETTPWEHLGYDNRENLRLADISLVATAYALNKIYYRFQGNSCSIMEQTLDKAFEKFCNVYEAEEYQVVRHNTEAICQIRNAHVVFKKTLNVRDVKNHPWRSDADYFTMKKASKKTAFLKLFMYGQKGRKSSAVLQESLTREEAEAIYNYYNSNVVKDSLRTFEQILFDAKINTSVLQKGKEHVMTLNTGASLVNTGHFDTWDNDWDFKYDYVVIANSHDYMRKDYTLGREHLKCKTGVKLNPDKYYIQGWTSFDDNRQFFNTKIVRRYK